jgi:hypothetical protein
LKGIGRLELLRLCDPNVWLILAFGDGVVISIRDVSLVIRNFKCFSESAHGFERIKPVNVIIGRNNSGKTTLLDLIGHATGPSQISDRGHKGKAPQTLLSWALTDNYPDSLPETSVHLNDRNYTWSFRPRVWATRSLAGKNITWELSESGTLSFCEVMGCDDTGKQEHMQLK